MVVKAADMADEMQSLVIDICKDAVEQYVQESDIAGYIKKNVEARDSPVWHCIVGVSFGSYVAHSRDHFIHLKIKAPNVRGLREVSFRNSDNAGWCYILLFKTH